MLALFNMLPAIADTFNYRTKFESNFSLLDQSDQIHNIHSQIQNKHVS